VAVEKIDEFDIISAAYLLHYAKNRQELLDMCKQIKSNLAVNGKFFGSIGRVPKNKDLYKTHNLTFTCEENDGAPATLDVRLGEVDFQIKYFYYTLATFEWAFKTADFSHFEWVNFKMQGLSAEEQELYKDIIEDAPSIGLVAW